MKGILNCILSKPDLLHMTDKTDKNDSCYIMKADKPNEDNSKYFDICLSEGNKFMSIYEWCQYLGLDNVPITNGREEQAHYNKNQTCYFKTIPKDGRLFNRCRIKILYPINSAPKISTITLGIGTLMSFQESLNRVDIYRPERIEKIKDLMQDYNLDIQEYDSKYGKKLVISGLPDQRGFNRGRAMVDGCTGLEKDSIKYCICYNLMRKYLREIGAEVDEWILDQIY